ncbi:uncharacterized protein LOC134249543 [Saccostrea cucullata]|uniref:uncharacterized protein LOC134249543 n=1 Tax=Saccostrea cuccullata TaxID=36930 RepID=UPI002ED2DC32
MEDYQSASNECHATVTPQTYNNKGCYKALIDILMEERDKHKIKIEQVLCEGMKILIAMVICMILLVFGILGVAPRGISYCCNMCKKESKEKKGESHNGSIPNKKTEKTTL